MTQAAYTILRSAAVDALGKILSEVVSAIDRQTVVTRKCNCSMQVYQHDVSASGTILAAADEAEVRGCIFGFLQFVNSVTRQCGLSEYQLFNTMQCTPCCLLGLFVQDTPHLRHMCVLCTCHATAA